MQLGFTRTILAISAGMGILVACGGGESTDLVENPDLLPHARGWAEMTEPADGVVADPNAIITGAKATGLGGTFTPTDLYTHYGVPGTVGVPIVVVSRKLTI